MKTSQFEGCKVALKQDRTGYILTLSIHPNDVPEEKIMTDGYYCVVCGRFLLADEDGLIIHDDIPHPPA